MKSATLTPKIEADIREALLTRAAKGTRYNTHTITFRDGKMDARDQGCAAYVASQLVSADCLDIVGVAYGGWTVGTSSMPGYGPEALEYLTFLMSAPAFKNLYPYMVDTDPEKIFEARGFIFHRLSDPGFNFGLFFTFMIASRHLFEQPHRIVQFKEISENYPVNVGLLMFLTLDPDKGNLWRRKLATHGDPFGHWDVRMFPFRFLSGETRMIKQIRTAAAQQCFSDVDYVYNYHDAQRIQRQPPKTLDHWAKLLLEGKYNETVAA